MKKTITWLSLSIVVFYLFMLLTILYGGSNGMGICFLLFFLVNPLFFIVEGIVCGLTLKSHWWLPLASSVLYLLSTWLFLEIGEMEFVWYAGIYLGAGVLSMLGAHFGKKLWKEEREL